MVFSLRLKKGGASRLPVTVLLILMTVGPADHSHGPSEGQLLRRLYCTLKDKILEGPTYPLMFKAKPMTT